MFKKKTMMWLTSALILICVAIVIAKKSFKPPKKPYDSSIGQIMAERSLQAGKQLQDPLGRAVAARNWPEVQQLYQPDKQFIQLGEIIRALFIENKIKEFQANDYENLMTLVLTTFEQMPEKNTHLAGMLVNQFERLPTPKHASANYGLLAKWAKNPKELPLKRKLAVIKLVMNDADPDPAAIKLYQRALIDGDTLGGNRNDWIRRVEEIRNHHLQQNCVELLAKNFKKIQVREQPQALLVLVRHLDIHPEETKQLTLQFLDSEAPAKFEAALRALTPLLQANELKDKEKNRIVKRLTNLPSPVKTPFVEMKSLEILKSIKTN